MFFFIRSVIGSLRRRTAIIPGGIFLGCTIAIAIEAASVRSVSAPSIAGQLNAVMLAAWICAHLVPQAPLGDAGLATDGVPIVPAPRSSAFRAAWIAGSGLAVVAFSTWWLPISAAVLREPLGFGPFAVSMLLAAEAAFACALIVWGCSSVLPRAAAVAASAAWLLLCNGIDASAPAAGNRLATVLFFPVSPSFLASDEAAHLGTAVRVLGSVALFDLGLFALVLAAGLRRRH